MVTAASTANVAIILIDARKGVLTQTRRHSYLAKLVGIPHVVVAVNKMDLSIMTRPPIDRIVADYPPSPSRSASTTCASFPCRPSSAT
jgi:sulfate adenylyltransferase subunit 1